MCIRLCFFYDVTLDYNQGFLDFWITIGPGYAFKIFTLKVSDGFEIAVDWTCRRTSFRASPIEPLANFVILPFNSAGPKADPGPHIATAMWAFNFAMKSVCGRLRHNMRPLTISCVTIN